MSELTQRQKEFLLLFAGRSGQDKGITTAAELYGVSKPTVMQITCLLEQRGYLEVRDGHGTIVLTELGWNTAGPLISLLREAAKWLTTQARLEPYLAENVARKLVTSFEPEIIQAILDGWRRQLAPPEEPDTRRLDWFLPGCYQMNFQVRKSGKKELSMGDQGFAKPAVLECTAKGGTLKLWARQLEYRGGVRKRLLRGTLERLWYERDGAWMECERDVSGAWLIPYPALLRREEKEERLLCVRIRARSTVGPMKMPESEAELTLFPEQAKRLLEQKKEKKAGMQQ